MSRWRRVKVLLFCLLHPSCALYDDSLDFTDLGAIPDRRLDFCPRMEAVVNGSLQRRDALRGLHIHMVAPLYDPPWLDEPKDNADPELQTGFHAELAKMAAAELGFNYTIHTHPLSAFRPGLSWSDYLNRSLHKFDANLLTWVATDQRALMGITPPHLIADMSLVAAKFGTLKEETLWEQVADFAGPFSWHVWGAIVAVAMITSTFYFCFEDASSHHSDFEEGSSHTRNFLISMWLGFTSFTTSNFFNPTTCKGRFLTLTYSFMMLLLLSTYTANLAAALVSERNMLDCKSFEQCLQTFPNSTVCVQKGTAMDIWLTQSHGYLDKTRRIVRTSGVPWNEVGSESKCGMVVDTVAYVNLAKANEDINPRCTILEIGQPLKKAFGGWMARNELRDGCTQLFHDALSVALLDLSLRGAIHQLHLDLLNRLAGDSGLCIAPGNESACLFHPELRGCETYLATLQEDSYDLEDMQGPFGIHAIGIIVSGLMHLAYLWKRRRQPKQALPSPCEGGTIGPRLDDRFDDTASNASGVPACRAAEGSKLAVDDDTTGDKEAQFGRNGSDTASALVDSIRIQLAMLQKVADSNRNTTLLRTSDEKAWPTTTAQDAQGAAPRSKREAPAAEPAGPPPPAVEQVAVPPRNFDGLQVECGLRSRSPYTPRSTATSGHFSEAASGRPSDVRRFTKKAGPNKLHQREDSDGLSRSSWRGQRAGGSSPQWPGGAHSARGDADSTSLSPPSTRRALSPRWQRGVRSQQSRTEADSGGLSPTLQIGGVASGGLSP